MRGCGAGVAGPSHIPENITGGHPVARVYRAEAVQVRVIVRLEARTEDEYDVASQRVGPDPRDETSSGADDRSVERSEDVDPLVPAAALPWCAPCIGQGRM